MLFKTTPRAHQQEAIDKLYGKSHFALFCDPGTGKTKISIDMIQNLYIDGKISWAVITAPNRVHTQWIIEQFPIHCAVDYRAFIYDAQTIRTKSAQKELDSFLKTKKKLLVVAINIEAFAHESFMKILRKIYTQIRKPVIVINDESTRIKNPKAKRTQNILKFSKVCEYRGILTGTPFTKTPFNLWSQFEFLQPNFFGCNYFMFQHTYGLLRKHSTSTHNYQALIGESEIESIRKYRALGKKSVEEIALIMNMQEVAVQHVIEHPELKCPYRNLDKLKKIIEPITFIKTIEECLDLPLKIYETVPLELSKKQKELYQSVKRKFIAVHDGKELSVTNKMVLGLRLQQITGGFFPYNVDEQGNSVPGVKPIPIEEPIPKIKRCLEDIEEIGYQSTIIWARFTIEIEEIAKALQREYGKSVVEKYYGPTPPKQRDEIKVAFQEGEFQFLVANPAVAGIGLNLQRSALHYYYSNDFDLEKRIQAEGRGYRDGQTRNLVIKDLVCVSTIDERVATVLQNRKELLEYFKSASIEEFT